jgi:hypothetical protein
LVLLDPGFAPSICAAAHASPSLFKHPAAMALALSRKYGGVL